MIFAIDVDNTLLHEVAGNVVLNHDVVAWMRATKNLGLGSIIVWSGGGADYAAMVVRKFGLSDLVAGCYSKTDAIVPDITLDDQECKLGTVNLRLAGYIVPTPWMGV